MTDCVRETAVVLEEIGVRLERLHELRLQFGDGQAYTFPGSKYNVRPGQVHGFEDLLDAIAEFAARCSCHRQGGSAAGCTDTTILRQAKR